MLRRYDPRTTEGFSDALKYHAMVSGADISGFKELFRGRVLVPYVARPFYWFAQRHCRAGMPVSLLSNQRALLRDDRLSH